MPRPFSFPFFSFLFLFFWSRFFRSFSRGRECDGWLFGGWTGWLGFGGVVGGPEGKGGKEKGGVWGFFCCSCDWSFSSVFSFSRFGFVWDLVGACWIVSSHTPSDSTSPPFILYLLSSSTLPSPAPSPSPPKPHVLARVRLALHHKSIRYRIKVYTTSGTIT